MQNTEFSVYQLLTQLVKYKIPVFQRPSAWTIKNGDDLFDNLLGKVGKPRSLYVGPMYFKTINMTTTDVIDGQQRTTAFSLILKAMAELTPDENMRNAIMERFLLNRFMGEDIQTPKIVHLNNDIDVYRKIILSQRNFTKEEKESNLFKLYEHFKSRITEAIDDGYTYEQLLDVIQNAYLTHIDIGDCDAREIFANLNSTGKALTNAELIKIGIFLPIMGEDEQLSIYRELWEPFETIVESKNLDDFFFIYLSHKMKTALVPGEIHQTDHLSKKNIVSVFENFFHLKTKEDVIELLTDMLKYANYYSEIYNYVKAPTTTIFGQKMKDLVETFGGKNIVIPLFFFYEKKEIGLISNQLLEKVVDLLSSFAVRSKLCRSKNLDAQKCAMIGARLENVTVDDNYLTNVALACDAGRGNFVSDEEFTETILTSPSYTRFNTKFCQTFLFAIERHLHNETPTVINTTIEHIMPQELNPEWEEQLIESNELNLVDKHIHTFGNLTLTKNNSKMSNHSFTEKKEEYERSNFSMTRQLSNHEKWTIQDIKDRSLYLANLAIEIWPNNLPQSVTSTVTESEYTLNTTLSVLSNSKPVNLHLINEDFYVDNWVNLVIKVAQKLYSISSDTFYKMIDTVDWARTNIQIFKRANTKTLATRHISNDVYFEPTHSVERNLLYCKTMIEFFDKELGTEFIKDISFSARRTLTNANFSLELEEMSA